METISVKMTGSLFEGKAPAIIQTELEAAITEATMFLLPRVKSNTPQGVFGAQGGLLGSIQAAVSGKGTPIVKGVVATAQKYGEVIEKGRQPGKGIPPKGSLVRWLEVKLGLSEKDAQRVEFVVRRKIGLKGFKGAHMFEKSVQENWPMIESIFTKHGIAIARQLNGEG